MRPTEPHVQHQPKLLQPSKGDSIQPFKVDLCVSQVESHPIIYFSSFYFLHKPKTKLESQQERESKGWPGVLWVSYQPISHTHNSVEFFNKIMHLWCLFLTFTN